MNGTWGALLTLLPILLLALIVLLPVVACARSRTVTWQAALALVLAGLALALLLALLLTVLLQALSNVWPGLNPMQTPAHEPIEAGIFILVVSLNLALAAACLGQWLYLRPRRRPQPSKETR